MLIQSSDCEISLNKQIIIIIIIIIIRISWMHFAVEMLNTVFYKNKHHN